MTGLLLSPPPVFGDVDSPDSVTPSHPAATGPVDAVDRWLQGDRTEAVARAVAAVAARQAGHLRDVVDVHALVDLLDGYALASAGSDPALHVANTLAIASLLPAVGGIAEAVAKLEQAERVCEVHLSAGDELAIRTRELLATILSQDGREADGARMSGRAKAGRLENGRDWHALRQLALERFSADDPYGALDLYLKLLKQRFEIPSTCCHIARVYLYLGEFTEVKKWVEEAKEAWNDAEPYVRQRIRVLEVLLVGLDLSQQTKRHSPDPDQAQHLKTLLQAIASEFASPGVFHQWDMSKVVDRIADHLDSDFADLLRCLVAALSHHEAVKELENTPIWRLNVA